MKKSDWFHLIDAVRGFALFNMLAYHFLYDIMVVFGFLPGWYMIFPVKVWQQFICITFIFISGISWHFGSSNFKRGILMNLYGCVITIVTLLFLPSEAVWFGILNFIGCAVLLMIPVAKLIKGRNPYIGFSISILSFLLLRNINDGYIGFRSLLSLKLPAGIYESKIFTFLGFPYTGFTSSDYFPILPWFFLFLAGYCFWDILSEKEKILNICRIKIPVLSIAGSKSIWIYLAHQPILYGAAYALSLLIRS